MNLKELIFGGGVKDAGGNGGAYRDSIQAWLPIKNIVGGVIVTKDNRFVKVCEVLPVNFYLKSPADQENIILSFAAYPRSHHTERGLSHAQDRVRGAGTARV